MEKTIRILHVIGIMDRGGAETMIMNYYRNVDREKIQFDFVENTYKVATYDDEIKQLGGRIYNCPHFKGTNYFEYKKWWKEFWDEHQEEYKIVHGHIGSCAAIYLGQAKKRGIFTVAHSHSANNGYNISSLLYRALSYRTRYVADYFFACSEAAGIDRYGKHVVKESNYKVLNNAIDSKKFQYDVENRKKIRNEFNISDDTFVIGHVGSFGKVKNHTFLLDIFEKFKEKKPNAVLILVGDGQLKSDMEEKARRLNISGNCIFTGIRSDVDKLMQAFDILIFPSLYEGLPVTLVEAQAAGLPVIISDNISQESIIIKELGQIKSLGDSPEKWADIALKFQNYERKDVSDKIAEAGYDIKKTAKELEEFYFEKYRLQKN